MLECQSQQLQDTPVLKAAVLLRLLRILQTAQYSPNNVVDSKNMYQTVGIVQLKVTLMEILDSLHTLSDNRTKLFGDFYNPKLILNNVKCLLQWRDYCKDTYSKSRICCGNLIF